MILNHHTLTKNEIHWSFFKEVALFYGPSNGALRAEFWYRLFFSVRVISWQVCKGMTKR